MTTEDQADEEWDESEEVDSILQRKWRLAVLVGLALAIISTIWVWVVFKPQYEASVLLQIEGSPNWIAFEPDYSREQDEAFVATQVNLLSSHIVLLGSSAYLKQPGSKSVVQQLRDGEIAGGERLEPTIDALLKTRVMDPRDREVAIAEWIRERITVHQAAEGSSVYRVSLTSPDAEFSQSTANAIVGTYFDILKAHQGERDRELLDLLRMERERRRGKLTEQQVHLQRMMADAVRKGDILDTDPLSFDRLSDYRDRLAETARERARLSVRVEQLTCELDKPIEIPEERIDIEIERDYDVLVFTRGIRDLAAKVAELKQASSGEENPEAQDVSDRRYRLAALLESRKSELRPAVRRSLESAERRARAEQPRGAELLLEEVEAELSQFKQEQDRLVEILVTSPAMAINVAETQRELKLDLEVLTQIERRIEILETERAARPRVELLRWADKPERPIAAYPYHGWIVAWIGSLCLPIAVVLVLTFYRFVRTRARKCPRAESLQATSE